MAAVSPLYNRVSVAFKGFGYDSDTVKPLDSDSGHSDDSIAAIRSWERKHFVGRTGINYLQE